MENEEKLCPVFIYLYEGLPRKTYCRRLDSDTVEVVISDHEKHVIKHNVRDKRALVIFDGDIPCNGLPRSGNQIAVLGKQSIDIEIDHIRKPKHYELNHPYNVWNTDASDFQLLRRAILLPAGKALVVRYRPKSLAVWYCVVDVRYEQGEPSVNFLNCTY